MASARKSIGKRSLDFKFAAVSTIVSQLEIYGWELSQCITIATVVFVVYIYLFIYYYFFIIEEGNE